MSGTATSKPEIDTVIDAFLRHLPPNPHKYGLVVRLWQDKTGAWQKELVTREGQPVSRALVRAHLEGNVRLVKHGLGYLPGTEAGTSVGVIDIDMKNYPEANTDDHEAVTLEDARQKVLDICEALGLFVYCEESTRGGWHLFIFFNRLLPYVVVRDALKAIVARAGLAASTEVYPSGGDASGQWVIMPYYGAATSADSLGRTFLQTADGEAIRFDELDEWTRPSDATIIAALAEEFSEDDAGREDWTEPDDLAPEALELLIEAAKDPDLTKLTDRHGAIVAFLNVADRAGRKAGMVKALKEEVRERWIRDGSRDGKTWNSEVDRWAKESKSTRKRGIKFLLEQGFKIPDLPKNEPDATANVVPWPEPLDEAAYHGMAGQVVRLIAPHTEADEAALLFQFLAAFGNAAGRSAHFLVESDRHYANLNIAIVGNSAKGRKGTSQGRINAVMAYADPAWSERMASGLSSGEGLIWAVRDPIMKKEPVREKGKVTGYQEVLADEGVSDKRLLVLEAELASPLKVMSREGNTLSAVVRNAWDTGTLRTLTKNSPAKATGAHVSIIGHITKSELLRHLDATEMANGFANRFLWICVRRSKKLPFGGNLSDNDLANIGVVLGDTLKRAKAIGRVTMDKEAREDWAAAYMELSEAKPGLFGSIIARAEAQVLRLALLYALLDVSSVICRVHLEAALACWDYAEASARYLFGETLGDPMADTILNALRRQGKEGMTRTAIRDLFDRHAKAAAIDKALKALADANLARKEPVKTGGRPSEVWYAC